MTQVVIENPILNSPYDEPSRHFRFSESGITDEVVNERRVSSYFMPVPASKKRGKQAVLDTEWTQDRVEENQFINQVRFHVGRWRLAGRAGVSATTNRLLDYWTDEGREKKLFFCQLESLETAIYLTEVARKDNAGWIETELRRFNDDANPGLYRVALKMATGTGKTVVMAMLIAWQALNKFAQPRDSRFSDAFLVVTPGITIKDRLRVLLPNDPNNYYRERDLLPPDLMEELHRAKILITNFHTFKPREREAVAQLDKKILRAHETGAFAETPEQMVRRACRELGNKKNVIVLNDEAHHCYRQRPAGTFGEEKLTGDLKKEAEIRAEDARIWISGLKAVKEKLGIKVVYDLSATPFFLRGSGYPEGKLFPWVVSDFSLVDAIESGIVKIPRVPVADDTMKGEMPTYRDLWLRIRGNLPKKGRKAAESEGPPKLPIELEGALQSLYGNYKKYFSQWEKDKEGRERGRTPPVFIVVCNNTSVSKAVFDYIAGWHELGAEGRSVFHHGEFELFSNVEAGQLISRPNTILVDSSQLESGEGMSDAFKRMASAEIQEFKDELRARFPDRGVNEITDDALLREVLNTVGKPGKLGEHVRCVVSVSMLTEGWDATTVTHILGVRAFSTQLLCEQVVGRALRRMSYVPNESGFFDPEYAEVYGVPFSFLPTSGTTTTPKISKLPTRVRALEDRIDREIQFPRLVGYRYEIPAEQLRAVFGEKTKVALSTEDLPTKTELEPIFGEGSIHTLDDLKERRLQEVAFILAKHTLERYFVDEFDESGQAIRREKPWLFPQLLQITNEWLSTCVVCKAGTFPQLLLIHRHRHEASDKIYRAIVQSQPDDRLLRPILHPQQPSGTTRWVDFDTTKAVYTTRPDKCHVSHVPLDSDWEGKLAQSLEDMDEVLAYVKNLGLGFTIPYTLDGTERQYIPDFIVQIDDGSGSEDPLQLLIEVSGQNKRDKAAKVETTRVLWIPAVNSLGSFGRWEFIEVTDPWDAESVIRATAKRGREMQSVGG